MAIILKEGKEFTSELEKRSALPSDNSSYYAVIDEIDYDKKEKHLHSVVAIYASKEAREGYGTVLETVNINFNDEQFDSKVGNQGITVRGVYDLALEMPFFADWKSDELD